MVWSVREIPVRRERAGFESGNFKACAFEAGEFLLVLELVIELLLIFRSGNVHLNFAVTNIIKLCPGVDSGTF